MITNVRTGKLLYYTVYTVKLEKGNLFVNRNQLPDCFKLKSRGLHHVVKYLAN